MAIGKEQLSDPFKMLKPMRLFVGKDFAASAQAASRGKDFPAGRALNDETYNKSFRPIYLGPDHLGVLRPPPRLEPRL